MELGMISAAESALSPAKHRGEHPKVNQQRPGALQQVKGNPSLFRQCLPFLPAPRDAQDILGLDRMRL
jgi:hypothetical protein